MFWNNKNEKKEQDTTTVELQLLDDIFHHTINALERLEMYLDGNKSVSLIQTSAGDKRDFHAEQDNRSSDAYYDELAMKCNSLFQAAKFDDKEVFQAAAEVFVKDTLEWYAGREGFEYNAVDSASIPIFVAITRQAKKAREVDDMFDEYVYNSKDKNMSIDEKYEATLDMVNAWIRAKHMAEEGKLHEARESEQVDTFTSHKRGEAVDGFKRLFSFTTTQYDTTFPAKLLIKTINEFAPDITSQFKDINEDSIEKIFKMREETIQNVQCSQKETQEQELKKSDIPFEIAEPITKCDALTTANNSKFDIIYPQLIEAVRSILDKEGVAYQDIIVKIL